MSPKKWAQSRVNEINEIRSMKIVPDLGVSNKNDYGTCCEYDSSSKKMVVLEVNND